MTDHEKGEYVASDFSDYIRVTLPDGRYIVDGELFDEIVHYANSVRSLAESVRSLNDIAESCQNILERIPKKELVMLAASDVHDPAGIVTRALERRRGG